MLLGLRANRVFGGLQSLQQLGQLRVDLLRQQRHDCDCEAERLLSVLG